MTKPGTRIEAIMEVKDGVVKTYGQGTYVGDECPPDFEDIPGFTNPKLEMDDGSVRWGIDCWWGPVERIKEKFKGREFEKVTNNEKAIKGRNESPPHRRRAIRHDP